MNTTSPSLLFRVRSGNDVEAWNRFVRLYTPLIFDWASRLSLTPHQAADLVQDVFLALLQQLPQFEHNPARSFRTWLCTITRNAGWNYLRRCELESSQDTANSPEHSVSTFLNDHAEPFAEREFQQYLASRALRLMQSDFPPATWQAFWGLVVESRTATQLSEELRLPPRAVYFAKAQVLRRLRDELDGMDV